MKIQIAQDSVTPERLQQVLTESFPQYEIVKRGKKFFTVKKSGAVGADVLLRSKAVIVRGNFGSMGMRLLLATMGFLLYLIVFYPKQKKMEKEVGNFLKDNVHLLTQQGGGETVDMHENAQAVS